MLKLDKATKSGLVSSLFVGFCAFWPFSARSEDFPPIIIENFSRAHYVSKKGLLSYGTTSSGKTLRVQTPGGSLFIRRPPLSIEPLALRFQVDVRGCGAPLMLRAVFMLKGRDISLPLGSLSGKIQVTMETNLTAVNQLNGAVSAGLVWRGFYIEGKPDAPCNIEIYQVRLVRTDPIVLPSEPFSKR